MKAIIIGGGIGGLSTALRFQQIGIDYEVYEQAPAFKPVGAGILLAPNALDVFQRMNILKEIQNSGMPIHTAKITDQKLKAISAIDSSKQPSVAIHRAALQNVLLNQLDPDQLFLEKKLKRINDEGLCEFEDGSFATGDFIVGADGIHSKSRNFLDSEIEIRDAGHWCWRAVVNFTLPDELKNGVFEAWGNACRFGFMEITPGQVYWFAVIRKDILKNEPISTSDGLADYYQGFDPIILSLIQKSHPKHWHLAPLEDLAPYAQPWYKGKVCLLGDAAHATTPNMGQGACQAIEDAYALGLAFSKKKEVTPAFQYFYEIRRQKAWQIVRNSWQIGKMGHLKSPLAQNLRNTMMRMIPSKLAQKSLTQVLDTKYLNA